VRRYGFSLLKLAPATGQSDAEAASPKPRTCLRANQEGFYGAGRLRDRPSPKPRLLADEKAPRATAKQVNLRPTRSPLRAPVPRNTPPTSSHTGGFLVETACASYWDPPGP